MKRSEQHDQITRAFLAAKAQILALPLVKDAQGDKAKYIKLGTLLAAVEPILLAQKCALVQGCGEDVFVDGVLAAMKIETTMLHESGQWMSNVVILPVAGSKKSKQDGGGFNQPDQQAGGVTFTYGRRYGVMGFFSIAVDEDSDGAVLTASRRRRALTVAENVAGKTDDRLQQMKDRLNAEKVICACGAKTGEAHKEGCKNAGTAENQEATGGRSVAPEPATPSPAGPPAGGAPGPQAPVPRSRPR